MNSPYKMPSGHTVGETTPTCCNNCSPCEKHDDERLDSERRALHTARKNRTDCGRLIFQLPSSWFSRGATDFLLPGGLAGAGDKRIASVEREPVAVAHEYMDKGEVGRDFGDAVEADLPVVVEHPVIGILGNRDRPSDRTCRLAVAVPRPRSCGLRDCLVVYLPYRIGFYGGCKYHTKRRESTLNTGIEVQPSTYPLDR